MYYSEYHAPDEVMIDAILLQALAALVEQLKVRLGYHFEVSMRRDIIIELEKARNPKWPEHRNEVLSTWSIQNVEHRQKQIELSEIKGFAGKYDCSIEELAKAFVDVDAKKRTGPPPSLDTRDQRVTKLLKDAGHKKISLGVVTRYRELLERHRPGLIPTPTAASASAPTAHPASASVVQFKKPNGKSKPDGSNGDGPTA